MRGLAKQYLLLLLLAALAAAGCSRGSDTGGDDVLARVGPKALTRDALAEYAGRPADSLTAADRTRLVSAWIESMLIEQEGRRRELEKNKSIQTKLDAVRSELYRTFLLSELATPPPSDSVIELYYEAHKMEFLRPVDSYLIQLYWGDEVEEMNRFRSQLQRGDTSMITTGEVANEGIWLAESRELDQPLEHELSSLRPGEITFPRPYENGFRVIRLVENYPAGTLLDLEAVRDQIVQRMLVEESRARQDSLISRLRQRYPVEVHLPDSL